MIRSWQFLIGMLLFVAPVSTSAATLRGIVRDSTTAAPIEGANIVIPKLNTGCASDRNGAFLISNVSGDVTVVVSYMGYQAREIFVTAGDLQNNIYLDICLLPQVIELQEIGVQGDHIREPLSTYKINHSQVRRAANPMPDPLLMLKTLPGVTSMNDQTSLYNVRGGNYDENLIYLNGFEIHQLQLVRKGYLENPSLINQLMVSDMNLIAGSFPVNYGDKLSSVLEISYEPAENGLSSAFDLRTTGLTGTVQYRKNDRIAVQVGFRKIDYGYLLGFLQTKGDYQPNYADLQIMCNWKISDRVDLDFLSLNAKSNFLFLPESWEYRSRIYGNFQIDFNDGKQQFDFNTQMNGIRLQYNGESAKGGIQVSMFRHNESENTAFHSVSMEYVGEKNTPTFSILDSTLSQEWANNQFKSAYLDFRSFFIKEGSLASWETGLDLKLFSNRFDVAQMKIIEYPHSGFLYRNSDQFVTKDSRSGMLAAVYVSYKHRLSQFTWIDCGIRAVHTPFNQETIILPRLMLSQSLGRRNLLTLSVGRYAQPPLSKEYKSAEPAARLTAQQSLSTALGAKFFLNQINFSVEGYYKNLWNSISYKIDDIDITYSGRNDSRGEIWGVDAYIRWPQTENLTHWISAGYLVAREDIINDGIGYLPLPTDRRFQFAAYSEDRMDRFKNSKVHLRLIYGTGFPYTDGRYKYEMEEEPISFIPGQKNSSRLPQYWRLDIGFTQKVTIFNRFDLIFREEVLNAFDHKNVLSCVRTVWNDQVKNYLSGKIYNIGVSVEF